MPIPWWAKLGAKVVLSRLPAGYAVWQRLGLFKHGPMEKPEYAFRVFRKHYERVAFGRKGAGFVVVELGPGDTLGTALVAKAFGASRTWLVDVGPFARHDVGPYRALASLLRAEGLTAPDLDDARSLDDVLRACNATYLTNGLASLREIPDRSVDLVFSNAVYEHIRRAEVAPMTREVARILRDDGATSHSIDLKDHLGGGLANLRFTDDRWESEFMVRSGFYTNRLRWTDFVTIFDDAGLTPELLRTERWSRLPLPRRKLAPMFSAYPDDVLLVSDIDLVARHAAHPGR
ncbi:MAG TPA: class I SAM-dependent methyltransferase [Gemmatimonadaceae bacterium]